MSGNKRLFIQGVAAATINEDNQSGQRVSGQSGKPLISYYSHSLPAWDYLQEDAQFHADGRYDLNFDHDEDADSDEF